MSRPMEYSTSQLENSRKDRALPSCRQTKWSPLAYPSSSLFSISASAASCPNRESLYVLNSYFPLHVDVILAAVREMLILDKSIDKNTLAVVAAVPMPESEKQKSSPSSSCSQPYPRRKSTKRKRDHHTTDQNVANLGYLRHLQVASKEKTLSANKNHNSTKSITIQPTTCTNKLTKQFCDEQNAASNNVVIFPTAETIADCILKRTYLRKHEVQERFTMMNRHTETNHQDTEQDQTQSNDGDDNDDGDGGECACYESLHDKNKKPPRKVSDVDEKGPEVTWRSSSTFNGLSAPLALVSSNTPSGQLDDIHSILGKNIDEDTILQTKDDLPDLLEVSICVESYLHKLTYNMVVKMTETFDDKILREFLGYKSSMLKREKLVHKIADYLFDISHALFAWEQTENELTKSNHNHHLHANDEYNTNSNQPRKSPITPFIVSSVVKKKTDAIVRDSLFDNKALKKIGGCGAPSLFMHALSIGRLARNKISWEEYAKTGIGKKMLKHHNDNQAVVVGRNRRLHRSRPTKNIHFHLDSQPLSSSSPAAASTQRLFLTTNHGDDKSNVTSSSSCTDSLVNDHCAIRVTPTLMPLNIPITLTRNIGNNWGILLSKEESLCVVLRIKNESQICKDGQGLKEGDIITSIRNEFGESINISSATKFTGQTSDNSNWFKDITSLFKRSFTLHLKVQRIHPHNLSIVS